MTTNTIPAITITLRDLPKRLVISSDGQSISVANESNFLAETAFITRTSTNIFEPLASNTTFEFMAVEATNKTFEVTRSDNGVRVLIDSIAVNFGGDNKTTVILGAGLHLLVAIIQGQPGNKGSVTVEDVGTANLEIGEGTNSEFATIKIRV